MSLVPISSRMQAYQTSASRLLPRTPVVVEVLPKAASTDPFKDGKLLTAVMSAVCAEFEDSKFGYTDYSGCSVLLLDYPGWSGFSFRDAQAISSLAASVATSVASTDGVFFTARSFNLPKDEVINYFVWKQMGLAVKLLRFDGLKRTDADTVSGFLDAGPISSGNRWPGTWWRGRACNKESVSRGAEQLTFWDVDVNTPVFSEDREYVTAKIYK